MAALKGLFYRLMSGFPFGKMHEYVTTDTPFMTAVLIVRVHYLYYLYNSIGLFSKWDFTMGPQATISLVIPLAWISLVDFPIAIAIIRTFFIFASLMACLVPQWRWVRILAFISCLQFVSLYYSVLQLDVDMYVWLLSGFLFIFLPDGWGNPRNVSILKRQKFLLVFWACQALILMTYTMAGIGKLTGAYYQFTHGQSYLFEPKAAALHISDRLIRTYSQSPLGGFSTTFYYVMWPFFVGSVYMMLGSFIVAFRPRLHRLWGLGLILFHVANYFTMNIGFGAHILQNALLFLLSPFNPEKNDLKKTFMDLPFLGILLEGYFKLEYLIKVLAKNKITDSKIRLTAISVLVLLIAIGVAGGLWFQFRSKSTNVNPTSQTQIFSVKVDSTQRQYFVYFPMKAESPNNTSNFGIAQNGPLPVVIVLHGGGGPLGSAELMMERSGWIKKAEEDRFLAVFPVGMLEKPDQPMNLTDNFSDSSRNIRDWNDGSGRTSAGRNNISDVAFIRTVIDDISQKFRIDKKRIYVTGFSNGASMTLRVGAELSDHITAIAPVAGALFVEPNNFNGRVSLLNIVGSSDRLEDSYKVKNEDFIKESISPSIREQTTDSNISQKNSKNNNSLSITPQPKNHVELWKRNLNCLDKVVPIDNSTFLNAISYNCQYGTEVVLYTLNGVGHVYPGLSALFASDNPQSGDFIDATTVVWNFFKLH